MGVRIRKKWDLQSEQSGTLAVLALPFLVGGIAGCLLAALSSGAGAEDLCGYLTGYLSLAQEGELPRGLWALLWGQVKYLLAALVLGMTALGLAGLPLLFGIRGFFFSFPVACFCRVFGVSGLFPALVLFALPALLWTPALFIAGVRGFASARQLLRQGRVNFSPGGGWWFQAGLCAGLVLAAGLLEYWVVPVLLRAAARMTL